MINSQTATTDSQRDQRWSIARLRRITTSSHRYMAEVDGLRFIAIFGVLLFHVYYAATHVPGTVLTNSRFNFVVWPVMFGFRGVELFFVISGFILGLPFAQHDLSKGPPVKLGRFYLRRITRLEPPYILALLIFYGLAILVKNVHTGEPGFIQGSLFVSSTLIFSSGAIQTVWTARLGRWRLRCNFICSPHCSLKCSTWTPGLAV